MKDIKLNTEENYGPILNDYLIRTDKEDEIVEDIKNQYQFRLNLGEDKIGNDIEILHDIIFRDLIDYVNEFYFPITEMSFIMSNMNYSRFVGYTLYRFLCVDLIKIILPKIFSSDYKISDFISSNQNEIRNTLSTLCLKEISYLKQLNVNDNINNIDKHIIRLTYYIDFLNTDIEDFCNEFLFPCIDEYSHIL